MERLEARFNAVVTQLVRIHDDDEGRPQYATHTHIECKDAALLPKLQELAGSLPR